MTTRDMDGLKIVQAEANHLDHVAGLFDQYRMFYGLPSNMSRAREFIHDRMEKGDSIIFLAQAKIEGRAVALGFTQLYPSYSSVSMQRLWILNDLYVDQRSRNRGVGRALIDRACKLAIDTGAKGLILETAIDNRVAKRLYEEYGFAKDAKFNRYSLDL
ncbi:MAG: GNAT family N-acetyltransferase [Candidatus Krumholzibacteria bacterium]|nr:GNAT family N-acetyltransferase [Candidatus Krumholzibacteria bacterium]